MEANLERKTMNLYRNLFNTCGTHEETMEMIVPDALPDILRVVDADGVVIMRSKEAESGKASVGGVINATILYMPEGESAPIKLEAKIPFTSTYDNSLIDSNTRLTACVSLCAIDCRMLNPRKVLIRADVLTRISGYGPSKLELCSAAHDDNSNIEILQQQNSLKTISDVKEKTFVISDEYSLPASKPTIGEILKSNFKLTTDDMKTVGSKLIIKGTASVSIVYSSKADGELTSADFSSPYSQILEIESGEEPDFAVTVMPTGMFFDLADGPNGITIVTMELHAVAQVVVMENKIIEYITDAYSTMHELMSSAEDYTVDTVDKTSAVREPVRTMTETPVQVKSVVSVSSFTGKTSKTEGDDGCSFETPLTLTILYKTEDGRLLTVTDRVMVKIPWEDACENVAYVTSASCGDVIASPSTGGIDVRVNVDFLITATKPQWIRTITNLSYDETSARDLSTIPSVTVKRITPEETLWALAKRYNSTLGLIAEANGLEGEPEIGQLVLIPKRR